MKSIIFFILLFVSFCGFSQTDDGTLRIIDWKTIVKNVVLVNDSTYIFDADPIDLNDKGAMEREIGNYFVDFVGNRYKIIDSTLTTITVLDEYRKNVAPQSDQLGRVYQSVGEGEMEYVGGVDLTVLDELSKWKVQAADNQYWWELINSRNPYMGIINAPTIDKNGDGSLTIHDDGDYIFNEQTDGKGKSVKIENVPDTTLTVTDNAVSYIYIDFNDGNPFYTFTSDQTIFFNDATKLFVVRVTRLGIKLHFEEYGDYAVLLSNKHLYKDLSLTTFQRQSGLILSTTGTRISNISAGSAWFSIVKFSLDANISGSAGILYEYYLSSGVWNYQIVTSYDNLYYSDGTDRQLLNNNKFVAKYFFRDVGDDNEAYYFHGEQYNTEAEAKNEIMPVPPPTVNAHAIYVGKIVIKQAATTGTAYPRVWEGAIQSAGVFNHFDLSLESLSWTGSGHYDGESKIAAFDSTGFAITIDDNSIEWDSAFAHIALDKDTSMTNELITSVTYSGDSLRISEGGNNWAVEILSGSESTPTNGYINTVFEPTDNFSFTFPQNMGTENYFLWLRAYQNSIINGDSVQVSVGVKNLQKTVSGFSVDLKYDSCYVSYLAIDTSDWRLFTFENYVTWADTATTDTFGIVKPDGTTMYVNNGIISAFVASAIQLGVVKVDNSSIVIAEDGTISAMGADVNYTVQTLSGTTPTWDVDNGANAKITLTGNTTITMDGISAGETGNLTVINGTSTYTLNVIGYTNAISKVIGTPGNYTKLNVTGTSGKHDEFSWYYDGNVLIWNGNLEYIKQ